MKGLLITITCRKKTHKYTVDIDKKQIYKTDKENPTKE